MNKIYGKAIVAMSLCTFLQQSAHDFDALMNKKIIIGQKADYVALQMAKECDLFRKPTDQSITVCNNLLDQLNNLVPDYKLLIDGLKRYKNIPGVSKEIEDIEGGNQSIAKLIELVGGHWRPLKRRPIATKLFLQRAQLINEFNDNCMIPNAGTYIFYNKPQPPSHKIDMCNEILKVISEVQPTVEAMKIAELRFTEEELAKFKPARLIKQKSVDYWGSLQNKQ